MVFIFISVLVLVRIVVVNASPAPSRQGDLAPRPVWARIMILLRSLPLPISISISLLLRLLLLLMPMMSQNTPLSKHAHSISQGGPHEATHVVPKGRIQTVDGAEQAHVGKEARQQTARLGVGEANGDVVWVQAVRGGKGHGRGEGSRA